MADTADPFRDFRSIDYPIIDADAHVQEPPDLWESRAPLRWKARVPRVQHTDHGDFWLFDEGKRPEPVGFTASAGLSYLDFTPMGLSYDRIRPGMWQTAPRLADLDIDGIAAQVLYPSVTLKGAGTYSDDTELQCFCVRAYNEWLSEFCAESGGRLIPQAIIPTTGLDDALAELEWALRNGHRGVLISRMPNGGFDFTAEDERFFAAACEAQLPIVVHIGSFLRNPVQTVTKRTFTDLPFLGQAGAIKAGSQTLPVASDLLFSGMFEKLPDLKVVLVEANIGWIPTLLEQTDDMFLRYRFFTKAYEKMKGLPSQIFHRHFWATFMVDTVGVELRHRMNLDQIMWSTDYPHTGTDWPNSCRTIEHVFHGVPKAEVKKMLHGNVKRLYRLDHIPDRN